MGVNPNITSLRRCLHSSHFAVLTCRCSADTALTSERRPGELRCLLEPGEGSAGGYFCRSSLIKDISDQSSPKKRHIKENRSKTRWMRQEVTRFRHSAPAWMKSLEGRSGKAWFLSPRHINVWTVIKNSFYALPWVTGSRIPAERQTNDIKLFPPQRKMSWINTLSGFTWNQTLICSSGFHGNQEIISAFIPLGFIWKWII